jgi:hypothetical protein
MLWAILALNPFKVVSEQVYFSVKIDNHSTTIRPESSRINQVGIGWMNAKQPSSSAILGLPRTQPNGWALAHNREVESSSLSIATIKTASEAQNLAPPSAGHLL